MAPLNILGPNFWERNWLSHVDLPENYIIIYWPLTVLAQMTHFLLTLKKTNPFIPIKKAFSFYFIIY